MKKKVLIWGNGNTLKKNIHWINQIYDVVGITGTDTIETYPKKNLYSMNDALQLKYDIILVTSVFFEEIKSSLISYGISEERICYFEKEFEKERRMSFGEKNKNVVFYILRAHWQERKNGFFNFYARALSTYYYTEKKGYELLIDMKNYYTEYAGVYRYGIVNIWENYFSQPSEFSLEEVYESKNVILSQYADSNYNDIYLSKYPYCSSKWYIETYQILGKMYKNWLRPNISLATRLEKEIINAKKGKILGVLARGSDMVNLKPKGHFIPYNTAGFIEYIQFYMERLKYEYLYLATEDENILEMFRQKFDSEKLTYSDQMRFADVKEHMLMDIAFDREHDGYLRGEEYCMVVIMLSRCDALLANCLCGGVLGAIALNAGDYNDVQVIDSGKYL